MKKVLALFSSLNGSNGNSSKLADDYLSSGYALVNAMMFARAHKDIKASVRDIQQQHK